MSEWYEAKDDDIAIDRREKEVQILVTNNDSGNVYVTLTSKQIENIAKAIREG